MLMTNPVDPLGVISTLETSEGNHDYYSLEKLGANQGIQLSALPYSIRVLLENALRHSGQGIVSEDDVAALAGWTPDDLPRRDVPFMPGRVLMQDFTGSPGHRGPGGHAVRDAEAGRRPRHHKSPG